MKLHQPLKNDARRCLRRRSFLCLTIVAGVLSVVAVVAIFFTPKTTTPTVIRPNNLEMLEPALRDLIESKLAAATEQPNSGEKRGELGLVFAANGLWTEAHIALKNAVELGAKAPEWRLHYAIALSEIGKFPESLNVLQDLVRDAPDMPVAQQRLGYAYLQLEQLEDADACFRQVIACQPNDAAGHVGLAEVALRQGQTAAAQQSLQRAIELDSSNRTAHYLLGRLFRQQGNLDSAKRHLAIGQNAKPKFLPDKFSDRIRSYAVTIRSQHQLALRFMSEGKFAETIQTLEAVLQVSPNDTAILNLIAGAHMQLNQPEQAFSYLNRAEKVAPNHHSTQINLASYFLASSELEKGLWHAERAIETANWILTAHYLRIQILIKMKRIPEARRATASALRIAPQDATLQRFAKNLRLAL